MMLQIGEKKKCLKEYAKDEKIKEKGPSFMG